MARTSSKDKGTSLAKGPVAIVGLLLLAYGVTAFIFGGHSFAAHPIDGAINGKTWLGLEVNAWSSLLFVAAGLPTVMLGTSGIERAHAVDEWVDLEEVAALARTLIRVICRFDGG